MLKLQWCINVNKPFVIQNSKIEGVGSGSQTTFKEIMRKTVESGQIKIVPEHFSKTYFHWIENLRDWCISRQIWYGHRIPVFFDVTDPRNYSALLHYRGGILGEAKIQQFLKNFLSQHLSDNPNELAFFSFGDLHGITFRLAHELIKNNLLSWKNLKYYERIDPLEKAAPLVCVKRPVEEFYFQETDTLDTWFSSGLWTFSTLGWPEKTKDLELFHPTDVLETGYEILFFWVARMILMTGYALGDIPFKTVYLHGTVRDQQGRKMSKSLGNGIDPIDVARQFGADAGRMALVVGNTPGTDLKIWPDKIRGYKNFANKIWNATRFVIDNTADFNASTNYPFTDNDQKYINELHSVVADITSDMGQFRFYMAAEKIYHYFWHTFADVIIEKNKEKIKSGSAEEKASAQRTLWEILITTLKILHPFMPFVTETIWQELRSKKLVSSEMLMVEQWPTHNVDAKN